MEPTSQQAQVQKLAVENLFGIFETMCEGAISVDRSSRVVWINEKYLALLGFNNLDDVLGQDVEEIIPESLLRQVVEKGQPILLDIMRFGKESFVVSRLPIQDANNQIVGAVGFVLYDRLDYLVPLISKFDAMQKRLAEAERELKNARSLRFNLSNVIGDSPSMREVRQQVRRLANSHSPVLLLGETGTGKEMLAQSIHALSRSSNGPFVAVNMGAIPESLLEAEFFGVAPGAYTGADKRGRPGKFELANHGTLFLDEIADMPPPLQVKLIRAIEESAVERVGSNELRRVDVRIIAATSQDIEDKVRDGQFRKDLFYRLNVLRVQIPPLRERLSDLRPIAEALIEQICESNRFPLRLIDAGVVQALCNYAWPGNVRELRNVLEQVCVNTESESIDIELINKFLPADAMRVVTNDPHTSPNVSLGQRVAHFEREAIVEALSATGGKKAPAARLLGISRSSLYDKIREYKL